MRTHHSHDCSFRLTNSAGTVVVSDSGDFESVGAYKPQDATTNPSLMYAFRFSSITRAPLTTSLAAAKLPNYERLITEAVKFGKEKGG